MEGKRQIFSASRMLYRRRDLRAKSTPTEILLWNKLRRKSLGYKFKRQFSIDNYVIDFYCPDRNAYRTKYIGAFGIKEIRFTNNEIITNLDGVINQILYLLCLGERTKERG